MVDWSGHDGTGTARRYATMAAHVRTASPSYEQLCLGVAEDPEVLARLDLLPAPKRQPNLLLGAVRFLDGPVSDYPAFRSFVLGEWDALAATMSVRRTQTNEPRRTATLLPVLAALPAPLSLLEVGASAGLCLYPDRYAFRYDDGPVLGHSELVLACSTAGPVPLPASVPDVLWRAGLDLNPLDVSDDEDVRWLEALIWPEETERFAVLRAAVDIARADPALVHPGDLTRDLAALAGAAPPEGTLVIFHSAVLAYLDDAGRDAFRDQVHQVAARRPVVWLSNEAPGVVVEAPMPAEPIEFVLARDGRALGLADSHGARVRWPAA